MQHSEPFSQSPEVLIYNSLLFPIQFAWIIGRHSAQWEFFIYEKLLLWESAKLFCQSGSLTSSEVSDLFDFLW